MKTLLKHYNYSILFTMKSVLQIPITTSLKERATSVALDQGFSSLQEITRVFLTQLAREQISVSFANSVELSPEAGARLMRLDADISANKNTTTAHSVEELMEQLNAD